ncbi:MAG: hypothetical protein ACYTG0_06405 [Planctomycetota bacterium]|jgi:hypothetical protein
MTRPPLVLTLGGLAALLIQQASLWAAAPEIAGVHVGLAGRYKAGVETPVKVELRGVAGLSRGEIAVTVRDGDGVPSRIAAPLPCPADREQANDACSVCLLARFGRAEGELVVELLAGGRLLDRKQFRAGEQPGYPPALSSAQQLIVVVARASVGVEEAVSLLGQEEGQETAVVRLEDFNQLPTQWYAYEAVHAVVLSTSDPTVYADLEPASPRLAALDQWVHLGGTLVLGVGRNAEEVLAGKAESALCRLAPGRLERMESLRMTKAWEVYCGSPVQIPLRDALPVPYLVDLKGEIEASESNLPLVVRAARGFGQVVFVAADLDQPPFTEWTDRGLLIQTLFGWSETSTEDHKENAAAMRYGFTDLAGQLRGALDRFDGVHAVSFWLVVGLIALYVTAIGLGDYFLVRRVLRRMPLTWITFTLLVAAFSAGACVLAHRLKGDKFRVHQIDLVDVDVESRLLRGTAWANVFSPTTDRYDLVFRPTVHGVQPDRRPETFTAWLGLTGDALGGMGRETFAQLNPAGAWPVGWERPYRIDREMGALGDVPIQIWATKSLTGRWTGPAEVGLEGRLHREDGRPVGTITNRLGCPLSDCMLAFDVYAHPLGTIQPGESIRIGPHLERRELESLLTGRRTVIDEEEGKPRWKITPRSEMTPYDRGSVDPVYVLRAMMFFKAAGGRRYTQLANGYQGFVDLSDLLKTGRAVLVGESEASTKEGEHHGAELLCNGRPLEPSQVRHATLYRFVLPVAKEE